VELWTILKSKSEDPALNRQLDLNIASVRRVLATGSKGPTPGPGAEDIAAAQQMTTQDRQEMIEGMVNGLAERLKEEPEDQEGWLRLARSMLVLQRREEAKEALASLLNQNPEHAMGLFMLGQLYQEDGDLQAARDTWEKVLQQIPEDRPEYKTMRQQIESLGLE